MTALPTTITALKARFQVAVGDVEVHRGAPVGGFGAQDLVVVAHNGDPNATSDATWATPEWVDLAQTRQQERGQIECAAVSQAGDSDLDARAARAEQLADLCIAELRADRTLGGVVMSAQVTGGSTRQAQNQYGVAVVVPFTVSYLATV